jgi:hypothetical protein
MTQPLNAATFPLSNAVGARLPALSSGSNPAYQRIGDSDALIWPEDVAGLVYLLKEEGFRDSCRGSP